MNTATTILHAAAGQRSVLAAMCMCAALALPTASLAESATDDTFGDLASNELDITSDVTDVGGNHDGVGHQAMGEIVPTSFVPGPAGNNAAEIWQRGDGNFADIRQAGYGNELSLAQIGDANSAALKQAGYGNQLNLTQVGNGLAIQVEQHAVGQTLTVRQAQ